MAMIRTLTHDLSTVVFLLFLSFQFHPFMVHPAQTLKPNSESLVAAKNYLKAFGYLHNNNIGFEEFNDLESAIQKFQKFYNLNVSGRLDSQTIYQMSRPRCGVPDSFNPNSSKYTFFSGTPKWPPSKRHLTYTFKSGVEVASLEIMRYVFEQAFGQWSQVTSFTFEEAPVGASSADLVLGFFRRDHGDGRPFDGPGNVLAHAFAPTDGRLHFDGDEKWSLDMPPQGGEFDLVWVAIHEVGHLLGLQHSTDQNAIMYAFVKPGVNKRTLSNDDIAGIKALYS